MILRSLSILSGLVLLASFLGGLHPAGDSLAVFRVPLLVATALLLIWTDWPKWVRWPLAGGLIAVLGWHVAMRLDRDTPEQDVTLYQQNLLFDRSETEAFRSQLTALSPDFITLQEVSKANLPFYESLWEAYPAHHHCPVTIWLGEAVLSRHPMVPGTAFCSEPDGLAGMQVETPRGRVWLVSVHLRWPYPHTQAQQVDGLLPYLERLEGPVIMAGDFNAVAWSHTLRRMGRASGTKRVGRHIHSFARLPAPIHLGIDHVLTTPPPEGAQQSVSRMPLLGSDHHGIFARLALPDARRD
jgi:endonuclease/exonuclease/phosphatase (EEP) superfamily protein YafD